MATYQQVVTYSNEVQPIFEKHKTFISFNINSEEVIFNEYNNETTHISYKCDTIIVKNGTPTKDELIRFFVHQKFSIDDEIAIIRQSTIKVKEFEEYNKYVEDCKEKAKYIIDIYNENK